MQRFVGAALVVGVCATGAAAQMAKDWAIHDETRPMAKVVVPGSASATPATPPSDAPAKWKVADGYMEVVAGTGGIHTEQGFGDAQVHVEWMAPDPPVGKGGQDRGNSGVFLMGKYEVQVLDTYGTTNKTYADGQAAALYGQYPPLVNPARPPGQWQTYDIVFRAPRFDAAGKALSPARVTVLFNGVLVQDNRELSGPTAHQARPPYAAHPDKLPLGLQDHSHPVRFRNIWVRELPPEESQLPRS
ncbi:MAG: DUF1080 domain-containing protein [Acidobacteria bacterium]|nr:MAG: DUF1080 domain-containing protein [Acidobacteriota bacterium]